MAAKTRDFSDMESTLTHESIVRHGYNPHQGPDGFQKFMLKEHQAWSEAKLRAMSRYGSFPPYYTFNAGRLADRYWRRADIGNWFVRTYQRLNPELVKAAIEAGFVPDELPVSLARPHPRKRCGDNRKRHMRPKAIPNRKMSEPKVGNE